MANTQEEEEEEEKEGVLLYYKFVSIPDQHELGLWFQSLCSSLSLVGRVRIAPEGVNVTIGGTLSSLRKHIDAVKSHPWLGECDFKLASAHCSTIRRSAIAPEVGFRSLAVRIVKELVTLGVHPSNSPSITDAGIHLSAMEFHRKIQEGEVERVVSKDPNAPGEPAKEPNMVDTTYVSGETHRDLVRDRLEEGNHESKTSRKIVVLDVRNVYETRIGKFFPPQGVDFLDPQIRQYSDLPEWIDSNAEKLQNKDILMYCTGGVRCEMASAYIKKKGKGFQNVFQLFGGIQRYLEAFRDGGFFKGKNFVFDHRVAVSSSCPEVLGTCLNCGVPFDDYSLRLRCSHCRMLVLLCHDCQVHVKGDAAIPQVPLCELCKVNKAPKNDVHETLLSLRSSQNCVGKAAQHMRNETKLSSSFYGCSDAIDGRHITQFSDQGPPFKRKLRILCLHGFRQNASNLKGRLAAFTKKLKDLADFVFVDGPHEVPLIFTGFERNGQEQKVSWSAKKLESPRKRFAWLITPEMLATHVNLQDPPTTMPADSESMLAMRAEMGFDKDQYKQQSQGWLASLRKLEKVFSDLGPFDGVLGFSQGAAVAASLCLISGSNSQNNSSFNFGFVILCSGFISPADEIEALMSCVPLPLNFPSLHIFADRAGHDQQVVVEDSLQLRSLFNPKSAVVLTHSLGHIVPTQKEKMEKVKSFLSQFAL